MADEARERIQKLLVTGDNRLKQGVAHDKVRATFQLNAKNITESGGRLLTTGVFPDGTPLSYRIIDPRQFILSASFDL